MADKQPLNATFFAFKKRERGGVLWGASIAYAVLAILLFGGFLALNWGAVVEYGTWSASMSQNPGAAADPSNPFGGMPQSVMQLGAWYSLFMILFYLLLAAYEAACLRWMIRGETKGIFGLALDADTLRVYFTYWLWLVLAIVLYIVMAMLVFGAIAGVAMGGGAAQNDPSAIASAGIGAVAGGFLVVVLLIYFAVRFSPAAATSIAKRRFAFFDAWTVTKGRFWALFGAFLLLWLMYIVGICIFYGAVVFAVGGQVFQQMASGGAPSEADAMATFASPTVWIPVVGLYLLLIVGGFAFYVALFGVNARAAQAALEEGKITAAQI